MSLVYKNSVRENVTNIQTYIVDDSPKSTKYFRVSDVPQVLQKGKNLLRITAHPTNLVPGTQVYVDVRDSNGNAIYYEIPDYLENDKSRVISIWIYHDKGDDNTPNGEATITLAGIANVDLNGNPLPSVHRNKINVKWQTTVTVDRERDNTSQIIFKDDILPIVAVSQSVEPYENQPQSNGELVKTTQTGKVEYLFSGTTPIIQTTDGSSFNAEMVDGDIILNNFTEPALPETNIENPLSSTFFSSSIKEILNGNTLKPKTNFTSSFQNREDLIHTYEFVKEADYSIEYIQSGSNVSTENKRNFANLSFSNVDPITGVVSKIKVLQKSDGLPGDFELVNEVDVPFSSSFNIKVPIPSKNLKDPKILKLLYLNSEGSISRTETLSSPFVFDGDNIYIGGTENLISGSIFISNTLGTGIEIGGASSGFIRSVGYRGITSASLGKAPGGFVIYSGSGNLVFGEDTLDGVGMEFVGDNDDRHLIFTTANGGLLDVKTDKFFIGTENTQFISGSDGNIEISSSIFHLNPSANSGAGSLVIGANATILADLTVDNLRTPAIINGNASTETNSSSSIKADGFARFVSASIGGWDITTASIEGGNLIMKPEGILQTRDFASGLKGWKISSEGNGTAEFENVRIRGTLRTTTFEKESVNAVGGQLWVANSTTITGSITTTDTTMSVKNASGFSQGEILLIKKVDNTGFQTEYVLLESASIDGDNSNEDETHGRIMISRAYGSGTSGNFVGDLASAAQAYEDGQVIVSTGKLNTGYIKMNANPNDTDTPYMDIVERTGSGLYDVALKARLGDLGGLANSSYVFGESTPGFGLATDNVFLQGGIIAKTGSIGGIEMQDNKLFTGTGTHGNSNTGFYVDSGSQFSLGDKLVWNPSTEALTIRGSISLTDGTDVGDAIAAVSSPTGSRTVSMTADKYVITFDADGNEAPSNQTITLSAFTQSFGTATAYYEFLKDGTLQGSRGTASTFTVDTTLEKPTASTPKTYAVNVFTQSSGGTSVATDNLTLFGIQPGSDGAEGQDAVTAFLTNEAHTLPLSSSGAIQSYAGADTQMKVFEGITDKTSAYTFTESSPSHITATSSSNTFTIASTTTPHSGSVTITAASGSVSLSKIMSIGVTRQGDDGTDGTPGVNGSNAKTLIASVDSQVFAFDDSTDNSATPGSITFAFSQQNLNDTIQSSDITITTADSNTVTNFSFDNNSVSNGSGIVSGSVSFTGGFSSGGLNGAKSSLPLTISCTNDSLTDSVTVFKVEGGSDGSDAVTAFLTNESHTLPSQNDGTVVSFAGAVTDMEVFEGTSNKNNSYAFSRTSSTSVSSSISDNTITITSMAHDSGSVIITATSASVSLSKTMTLSKSKQGTAGLPGAAAKLLTLTSDSQVFAFPSASSSTPEDNDILIIVNQQNLSGTIDAGDITIKDAGGNTLTDPTFVASVTDGTGQVSGSITFGGVGSTVGGDKTKLPLTIEVAKDSLEDSLKIFKIDGGNEGQDGADAVTAFLTNESHTFAADSTGAIAVFTGGATDMEVFEGITNKTSAYTISRSSTTAVSSSINGKTITVTSMAHDSGSIIVNASSGSVSINKTMSLTKARQGVDGGDGTSAKLLIGSLDSQVMAFDDSSDNTATPTSIEFSFQQQNLSGSAGYLTLQSSDITIALNGGGNITNFDFDNNDVTNGTGIASGSISFTGNTDAGGMGGDKSKFPVTIAATKDGLNDTIKIFKVEGGADGTDSVQVILSNESHTLAAQNDGTVISFTGADTDVTVFEGITDKTSAYTISRTNGTGVSTNLLGDGSTYSAGASDVNVDVTGMTHDSGSVTINAASGSVSIDKIMSLTKAKQGQDGDKFADTSITTTINLTTLAEDDTLTFTADTGLAWTAGLTAVLSYDSSNFINGTVNSYNSANGSMSLNVDTITGGGTYTAWSLNVGGVAGPQGLSGANAKNIVASVDSQVFSFLSASDNTAEPTSVIFSFNQQNLNNATIGSGDVTITGADGTNITGFSLDNDDVDSNFSGIVSGSLSFSAATSAGGLNSDKTKLPVTISATKDGLTDSIKVFKVEGGTAGSDGTDAVTTFLTNEAHTFAAANNGNIVSFNGAFTDMEVFQGVTNVTSNYVISSSNGTGVTATDSGKRVTITAMAHDSGSVLITATSGSTQLTKTMSLVKSKQGAQGLAGDDAKMLTITSDSPVFSFASASSSTALDNTIELIINQQNLSATIDTNDLVIKDAQGNTLTNPALAPSSLTNNTGLVSGSITFSGTVGGVKTKLPLEITITQDGLEDSLKIFKVEGGTSGTDGTDAINGFLSNESHTFPADSTGAIASFVGGTSTMSVFEGVTDVTTEYTYSKADSTGVSSALGGTNGNVLTISALGHDSGSVDITAESGSGDAQVTITKTMSLTKARQGSDGSDGTSAKLLIGSLSSPVFTFLSASDTSADPLSIEFSFQQQNLSGSGGFITIGSSDIDVRDSENTQLTGFGFDNNDVTNGTGIVSGSITFASANNAGGVAGDKTKLPITITATKDGLSDSVTIFKIEGGTSGEDGASAVTALLTNDSHTLPIAAGGGSVISFAGASTDIVVFQGTSDVTNDYTINTGSVSSHITTTTSDDTVTITNSTTPYSGSVVITATSGSTVLSKTMTVSAAQQGSDGAPGEAGAPASLISLTGDSQVFTFSSASATTPEDTTIELFVTQQNLGKTLTASDITITDVDGASLTVPTFAPSTLSNNSGVISGSLVFGTNTPNGSNKNKFPITITATSESLSDTFKVFALDGGADGSDGTNGTDAITVILSNESHTIAAASDGTVSSFSGAETDVTIFEGVTDKTPNYFTNAVGSTGVTIDNDFNSFNSSSLNVTAMGHDSGSVTITSISGGVPHTGYGAGAGENWTTSQFVTNNQGDIDGTDNDFYLQSNPDTISVGTGDGELRNNYVEFGDNSGDDEVWIVGKDIVTYNDAKTYYVEARFKRINGSGTIYVGVNGWSNETTRRNINGSNSFGGQHYIAASGFNFDDGQGTDWVTMRGYFSGHSSTAGQLSGEAPDINNPKKIHTNATYISPMFLANYNDLAGKVRLDYIEIKEVKDGSGNLSAGTVKVDKTMTLAKSKAGTDGTPGTDAKTITISSDTQTFAFDDSSDTTATPTQAVFSINQQNLSGAIAGTDITITKSGGGNINTPTVSGTVTNGTGTRTFTLPFSSLSKSDLPLSVSVSKDSVTDSTSIIKVEGGANGVSALQYLLTNEAHIVPATSAGVVSSYSNSGTEIYVYEGSTELGYDGVGTGNGKWTVGTPTVSPSGKITVGSITDGGQYAVVGNHSSMNNSTDSVTISYPISGKTSDGTAFSFTKTQTIAKSKEGAEGAAGSDSKTVALTAATNVITYNAAGSSPSPSSTITLTADSQNFTDGYFKFTGDGITDEGSYTNGSSANQDTFTFSVPSSYFSTPKTIRVGVAEAADSTTELAFDTVTIVAVQPGADGTNGADAVTAFLTSEADVVPAAADGTVSSFAGSGTTMKVFEGITDKTSAYAYTLVNTTTGLTAALSTNVLSVSGLSADSGSTDIRATSGSVTIEKTYSIGKSLAGATGQTGATGPNFGFLSGSLSEINTVGGLDAGLLMTSTVFGFHTPISQGSAPYRNAQLSDFTSFLDNGGNFYLGGNASGASGSDGGYFAWNNTDRSLLISGSNAEVKVDKFFFGTETTQFLSGSNGNVEISGSNFHLDRDGNVKVSGEITVTNTGDFANPNAEAPIIYDFSGNGSQTITNNQVFLTVFDTDGDYAGGSGNAASQNSSTEGIYLSSNYQNQPYSDGLLSKNTQQRANNPILNWDFKIQNTSLYTSADIGIFKNNTKISRTDSPAGGNMLYGIRLNQDDILIRTYENEGTATTHSSQFVTGDVLRLQIRVKSEGGAELAIFKNGDFTTPIVTYSYGTDGTETTMTIGYTNASYQMAGHILKYVTFGASAPSSTVISGNGISTGKIESSNLNTSVGSELDLDAGTILLGGTSSPKFAVNAAGALTASAGTIGGVNIDTSKIYVGTGTVNNSNTGFYLDDSGNFSLKDKLYWNGSTLAITGNITVSNTDDFADPNADDSTTSAVFNKVVSPTSQILAPDGRPAGFFAAYGNNVKTTVQSSLGGDGIRRLMLYSATDSTIGVCTNAVEIQNGATYKISMKFKANAADTDGFYMRIMELDSLSATDDYGTNCSFNEGTLKGVGHTSSLITGEAGVVPNTRIKYLTYTNAADGSTYDAENGPISTSYVTIETTYTPTTTAKVFSVNVLNWSQMQYKQLFIEDLQVIPLGVAQGTQIGGDSIRTGLIKSLNLGPTEGSIINLDTGSMKMGGTLSPGFETTSDGFVTVTNIVEKFVVVTDANSGSYFETFNSASTDWTRLILDGSQGGNVTMNMTLETAPPYVISDLKFPANANIDSIAKLELTIATSSVQFNEGAVASGFSSFFVKSLAPPLSNA